MLVTNFVTFLGANAMMGNNDQENNSEESGELNLFEDMEEPGDFGVLDEVSNIIESQYIEEVDQEEMIEGALDGMLETLDDPQTGYMSPQEYQDLLVQTEGSYGGIGIEVFQDEDYVTIVAPISGTPGEEKGLRSGDRIVTVEGDDVVGKDIDEVVEVMRGEPGTSVEIEIERPGLDEKLDFEITRENIELDSVEYEMLDNNISHVELTNFDQTTGEEFRDALSDLKDEDMEGMILDLRDNPGGLLDAAIEVAEEIVPAGPIVHVEGRDGTLDTYESEGDGADYPMVVLVNENSASASEILAGALQDTDTAIVAGSETFGKASVQNVEPLNAGGGLRYTMAKYQTPEGRDIHEVGLTPDVELDAPAVLQLAREPISADLGPGDDGEEVETLQQILQEFGFYEQDITGDFDDNTGDALEEFQEEREISVTGEMDDMVIREFHEMIEEYQEEDDEELDRALELIMDEM